MRPFSWRSSLGPERADSQYAARPLSFRVYMAAHNMWVGCLNRMLRNKRPARCGASALGRPAVYFGIHPSGSSTGVGSSWIRPST